MIKNNGFYYFIGFQYIDYFNPALFFTDGVGHLALFFTDGVGHLALFFTGHWLDLTLFFTGGIGHLALFFTGHRLTLHYFLLVVLDTLYYFLQVMG